MIHFKKVAIIGVGLIGGSIGKALKELKLADEVVGIFRSSGPKITKAIKIGAVDTGATDIYKGVQDTDLVIIATPVGRIVSVAREVFKYANQGCIITDVGSTKERLVKDIDRFAQTRHKAHFIGGHPMAGSEKNGIEFARCDLFKNAPCILVKTRHTDPESLYKVSMLWQALGAEVVIMSPNTHDRIVANISHLPHLVACSLLNSVCTKDMVLSSGGFKDTTRIASSNPLLWRDIILTNEEYILNAIERLQVRLTKLKQFVRTGNATGILKELKKAKQKRDKLN